MKKLLAFALCLAMLLGVSALAETAEKQEIGSLNVNDQFTLKGVLADGYEIEIMYNTDSQIFGMISSEDETKPTMMLSIAFNEEFFDLERLNDMNEEDKALLEASFYEDELPDTVTVTKDYTAYGTELFVVHVANEDYEYVDIMTFYKGYSIEFVLVPAEGMSLTDEQVTMCIDFLSDLDFVPAEA